ncbi:hypothetical protein NM208_g4970 [Fusarium decemcellulare]|uniref:Uncharacterized protein n=1 Tax=Fusarium decemcellulare TaxID=57161 RepID=A0ACC1SIL6_9HYPO|nr:hypothetical protein NM208_g4970 [Fusarium decemcellulare]
MESLPAYALEEATRISLSDFDILLLGLEDTANNHHRILMPVVPLQNQRDRLKIWAENLGALKHGSVSLDSRLRDSSLMRMTILQHLEELQKVIKKSTEVVQGTRPPLEETIVSDEQIWECNEDGYSSEEDNGIHLRTELGQNMSEITAILSDLFKLSSRIGNSTTGSITQPAFETTELDLFESHSHSDRVYVQDSFREFQRSVREASTVGLDTATIDQAPETEISNKYLIERWSNSITARRQFFAHWQKRGQKLAREEPLQDQPVNESHSGPSNPIQITPRLTENSVLSEELATDGRGLDNGIDAQSMTSCVSVAFGLDGEIVELPQAPMVQPGQAHVLRDLQPYMCTYSDCPAANDMYGTRNEWLYHEEQAHRRVWRCPEHTGLFESKEALGFHLESVHQDLRRDQVQTITDLSYTVIKDDRSACPFCLSQGPFPNGFENHVAHHQERLASFALPRGLVGEVSSNPSTAESREKYGALDIDEKSTAESTAEISKNVAPKSTSSEIIWQVPTIAQCVVVLPTGDNWKDKHMRARACKLNTIEETGILFQGEYENLKMLGSGLRNVDPATKWYRAWERLFPQLEAPPSPYFESYVNFLRRNAPQAIRSVLELKEQDTEALISLIPDLVQAVFRIPANKMQDLDMGTIPIKASQQPRQAPSPAFALSSWPSVSFSTHPSVQASFGSLYPHQTLVPDPPDRKFMDMSLNTESGSELGTLQELFSSELPIPNFEEDAAYQST